MTKYLFCTGAGWRLQTLFNQEASILGERLMEHDFKSFVLTNVQEDLLVLLPSERESARLIKAFELETGSKITRTTYARFIMHRT